MLLQVSPEPQGPFMLDRPDPREPIPESDEQQGAEIWPF